MLTLFVAGSGCAGEGPGGPVAEVTDSAGVRVVTYDLSSAEPQVLATVSAPDLELGVVEGDGAEAFSRVVDLAVDRRGRLVVSDAGAPELRLFDEEGVHLRTIGQRGEGPGEFGSPPTIAGLSADTVFAFDRGLGRATAFLLDGALPDGVLVEIVPLRSGGGNRIVSALRQADGSFLTISPWTAPSPEMELHDLKLVLDSVVVERLDAGGESLDTIDVMADRPVLRMVQGMGNGIVRSVQAEPPFLPRAYHASNGSVVVSGRSDVFRLELRSGTQPPTILRVLGAGNPAGRDEIRAWQEERLRAELGDAPLDPQVRRLELDQLPDRLPAFADLLVSTDGDVWVAGSELGDGGGYDWLVFTPEGRLLGSVHTPPGLRLLFVGPTFVVGAVTDELGVPYIRRHPLSPPPS